MSEIGGAVGESPAIDRLRNAAGRPWQAARSEEQESIEGEAAGNSQQLIIHSVPAIWLSAESIRCNVSVQSDSLYDSDYRTLYTELVLNRNRTTQNSTTVVTKNSRLANKFEFTVVGCMRNSEFDRGFEAVIEKHIHSFIIEVAGLRAELI